LTEAGAASHISTQETYLSRVTAPNLFAPKKDKGRELDRLQEAGEPISNLSVIRPYSKVKQYFLVGEAQQGDEFAAEQLCLNAVKLAVKQTQRFIEFSAGVNDLYRELPADSDDLIQAVLEDVPKILDRYERRRGVSFQKLLFLRINYAIIDRLREQASLLGVNRRQRGELKGAVRSDDPNRALQELVEKGFVEAPQYVVGGQLSLASISLDAMMSDASTNGPEDTDNHDTEEFILEGLIDDRDPMLEVIDMTDNDKLHRYVDRLPERERAVVVRYYGLFDEEPQTLKRIGEQEGYGEARGSQIHAAAIKKLRKMMSGEVVEFRPQRRAGLENAPKNLSRRKLIQLAHGRLDKWRDKLMLNQDIEDAIQIIPAWDATYSYSGLTKITTFERELPEEVDSDELLSQIAVNERCQVNVSGGFLKMEVRDITGEDLQTLMQTELWLMQSLKIPEDEQVLGLVSSHEENILRNLYRPTSELAFELGIKESTVRTHVHNMCKRFGMDSFIDLAVFAARKGLIDLNNLPYGTTMDDLSPREQEILQGYYNRTYKEAAEGLSLSTNTIRAHWHNIYAKLNVFNRAQAALIAIRDGLIPLEPAEAAEAV
jgi:RNA polymerase sigma factor (sigma-70 family)